MSRSSAAPPWLRFWFVRAIRPIATASALLAFTSCEEPKQLEVRTTLDKPGGNSLRGAIHAANAAGVRGALITLPPGTYDLTRCGSDDSNASGDLDIYTDG